MLAVQNSKFLSRLMVKPMLYCDQSNMFYALEFFDHRMFALRALSEAGAQLTTSESAILGFVQDATHPKFKDIAKIIKDSAPDSGLLGTPI